MVRIVQWYEWSTPWYEWSTVRMVDGTNSPWYEWSMVRFFENRALSDLGDLLAFLIQSPFDFHDTQRNE